MIKNILLMILDSIQKIFLVNTNNKGADQIAHVHDLISAFVIHYAHTYFSVVRNLLLFVLFYFAMISIVSSLALILLRKIKLDDLL